MIFARAEVEERLAAEPHYRKRLKWVASIATQTFKQDLFDSPEAEQQIEIQRATRNRIPDAVEFWCAAHDYVYGSGVADAWFEALDVNRFDDIVASYGKTLVRADPPKPVGQVELAMLMYEEWYCVDVLAVTNIEYFRFTWSTSA